MNHQTIKPRARQFACSGHWLVKGDGREVHGMCLDRALAHWHERGMQQMGCVAPSPLHPFHARLPQGNQ
jgi:hypothetical protein